MENKPTSPSVEALTNIHLRNKRRRWWLLYWVCFVVGSIFTFLASREFLPDNVRLILAAIGLPLFFISLFLISMTKYGRFKWSGDPWIP